MHKIYQYLGRDGHVSLGLCVPPLIRRQLQAAQTHLSCIVSFSLGQDALLNRAACRMPPNSSMYGRSLTCQLILQGMLQGSMPHTSCPNMQQTPA